MAVKSISRAQTIEKGYNSSLTSSQYLVTIAIYMCASPGSAADRQLGVVPNSFWVNSC